MADDFTIGIDADTGDASKRIRELNEVLKQTGKGLADFDKSLGNAGDASKAQAGMRRTLKTMGDLSTTISKVSKEFSGLSGSTNNNAQTTENYTRTLRSLNIALKAVSGTSEADYAAKSRTLRLMRELAQTSGEYAKSQQTIIRANSQATAEELKTNAAKDKAIAASEKLAAAREREAERTVRAAQKAAAAQQKAAAAQAEYLAKGGPTSPVGLNTRLPGPTSPVGLARIPNYSGVVTQLDRVTSAQDRYNIALSAFSEHAFENQFALTRLAGVYSTVAAVSGGLVFAIGKVGASFEQAFAELKVSVGINEIGQDFEALRQQFIDLSTEVPSSFEELTAIASAGAQMGIATEELEQFTKVLAMFSTQSNVSAEEAAKLFGRIQNLAHIPTADLERFASTVAKLGRDSAATESEILKTTQSIAASATEFGITEEKIVGLSTALASLGVPPEWARGALQRIFAQVNRAAAEGAAGMEKYAKVMGMSGQATLELYNNDPTAFFLQLTEGIGQSTAAGENFTKIMDDMGVRNVRDVQLLQRLSANHDLLAQSIGSAVQEYADGEYLQDNFNEIVNTTINTLKRLWNEIQGFAAAGAGLPLEIVKEFAEMLMSLMDALAPVLSMLSHAAPVIAAVIAPLFAIKAATALATASMSAFAQLGRSSLNTLGSQASALRKVATSFTASSIEQRAYNAEMRKHNALVASGNGANSKYSGSLGSVSVQAQKAVGDMTRTRQAVVGVQGAFTSAASAVRGFGAALGGSLLLGGVLAGIGAIISSITSAGEAAKQAKAEYETLIDGYVSSAMSGAGGATELQKAIAADTQAFKDAGYAANEANGVYATITKTYQDVGNGAYAVNEQLDDMRTGTQSSIGTYTEYGAALDNAKTRQTELANGMTITSQYLDDETTALGANVKAWQEKALLDMVAGISDEDLNKMKDAGVNVVDALTAGIEGGEPAVRKATAKQRAAIEDEIKKVELDYAMGDLTFSEYFPKLAELQQKLAALKLPEDLFGGFQSSLENTASKAEVLAKYVEDAAEAGVNLAGLDAFADFIDPEAVTDAESLATALQDVYTAAFNIVDIQGAIYNALSGLGESIVENGGNFDLVSEEGIANMEALKAVVEAYAAEMGQAIEEGMNPADAAQMMVDNVQAIMDQLSGMGIDTSQLDWLMDYVNQFVSDPKVLQIDANTNPASEKTGWLLGEIDSSTGVVQVDADTSAAYAKLKALADTMAAIGGAFAEIGASTLRAQAASMRPNRTRRAAAGSGWANSRRTDSAPSAPSGPSFELPDVTAIQTGALKAQEAAAQGAGAANRDAGNAARDAQDGAREATQRQNDELEQQKKYVSDLANYYKGLGSAIFAAVDAEGKTFKSLQQLGAAIAENGKGFNTFTENGRANFSALSDALSSFGEILSLKVERGVLDANGAMSQFRNYAAGMYRELLNLGVPASQIQGFFSAIGVQGAQGWGTNVRGVKQFAGVLTSANKAAKGVVSTVDRLSESLKTAKSWADILSEAFDNIETSMYGKQSARDAALEAQYKMRDAYQDQLDTIRNLREEQQKLNADLAGAQADKRKADIEAAISDKYGETDRAADYRAQSAEAQTRIDTIQTDIKVNKSDLKSLQDYMGVLKGNSKEAVENRKSLRDLQSAMIDSIVTYAEAGASTKQLNAYTATMRKEFIKTATESGYSKSAIAQYTKTFDQYVKVVKSTPKTVVTTATANVDPAKAALNTIPKFGKHRTDATANTAQARSAIAAIPKRGTYAVYPQVSSPHRAAAARSLSGLSGGRTSGVFPYVSSNEWRRANNSLNSLAGFRRATIGVQIVGGFGAIAGRAMGGFIPGFASGGKIPGTPPRDPMKDNMYAKVDSRGMIKVRSGEFIQPQPSVDYYGDDFMRAIQNRTLPQDIARFANGGMPAPTRYGSSGGTSGGSTLVELSPADRALLSELREVNAVLVTSDRTIAESANRGNTQLNRRGSNG